MSTATIRAEVEQLRAETMHLRNDDTYMVDGEPFPVWQIRAASQQLRTAAENVSVDQHRDFERELRRRDSGFMQIVSTNASLGTGTYEARTPAGQTSSKPFTFGSNGIITPTFAPAQNAGGARKDQVSAVTPAPDPYKKDLEAMRTASATPESTFEDKWKADRLAALERTRATLDAEQPQRRHAEAHAYPSPNPYEADLQRLRERDARALAAKENR